MDKKYYPTSGRTDEDVQQLGQYPERPPRGSTMRQSSNSSGQSWSSPSSNASAMPQPLSSGQSMPSPESSTSTPCDGPSAILPEAGPDSPPPDGSMSPTLELEYLSRIVFLIVRGLDTPLWLEAHISDIFKSEVDNFPPSMTWHQLREMFKVVNRAAKGTYKPIILNVLVDIHEHSTHADVLILIEATGRPVSLRRHTICRLRWRRREGRWQLYHALAIRSPSLFQFV